MLSSKPAYVSSGRTVVNCRQAGEPPPVPLPAVPPPVPLLPPPVPVPPPVPLAGTHICESAEHAFLVPALQSTHASPLLPHALADEPPWQAPLASQQPETQVIA